METNIDHYIYKTQEMDWKPLIEKGVDTKGIYVKPLRFDEQKQRHTSILLKFEAGAHYPYHNHPGGEELFVVEGSCIVGGRTLNSGDYLFTPPDFKHAVKTQSGCVILFIIPEEVEILNKKRIESLDIF